MATTKTKEPTRAEQRRAELAEAEQNLSLAEGFRQEALAARSKFEALKGAGNFEATPSLDIETSAGIAHWNDMVATHERRVTVAERRLLPDSPALAEAVAYALGTSVHGVPAEAAERVPEFDPTNPVARIIVTQQGRHTESNGSLSGRVTITQVAPAYVGPFDPEKIGRRLLDQDARPDLIGVPLHPSARFSFGVTAWAERPNIASAPTDTQLENWAGEVARELAEGSYSRAFQGDTIWATGTGAVVSAAEDDHSRLTVAEVTLRVGASSNARREVWYSPSEVRKQAQAHLMAQGNRIVPGVGRIEAVELGDAEPHFINPLGFASQEVRARLTVRAGWSAV